MSNKNPEQEAIRFGECADCGCAFVWTGAIADTPNCRECGRKPDTSDFNPSEQAVQRLMKTR